jgi:hypothetical protein
MRIVEYTDSYSYVCGIAQHKHNHTAYAAIRTYFKIMYATMDLNIRCAYRNRLISQGFGIKICPKLCFNHWINIEIEKSIE